MKALHKNKKTMDLCLIYLGYSELNGKNVKKIAPTIKMWLTAYLKVHKHCGF